jgi:hypothetical protein
MFVSKVKAYTRRGPYSLLLFSNIRLGYKDLGIDKHSSLLVLVVSGREEKFYRTGSSLFLIPNVKINLNFKSKFWSKCLLSKELREKV